MVRGTEKIINPKLLNMKRTFILTTVFFMAVIAMAMQQTTENKEMILKISLPNNSFDGKLIYLKDIGSGMVLDSATVKEQKAMFTRPGNDAAFYAIDILGTQRLRGICIGEKGSLSLSLQPRQFPIATGAPLNDEVAAIDKELVALTSNVKTKEERAAAEEKQKAMLMPFFKKHNNDGAGAYTLLAQDLLELVTDEEFSELYAVMGSNIRNMKPIQQFCEMKEAAKKTQKGAMFVDIVGTDEQGKTLHLSDFVGKGNYVLMDMWASWCGPCRREIPNLLQLHQQYHDKGLTVLGVFVWDELKNLQPAKEKEGIVWPQLIDSNKTATKLYGVYGIPQIILFAPDGTVIARDLRGEHMINKVNEVMKK